MPEILGPKTQAEQYLYRTSVLPERHHDYPAQRLTRALAKDFAIGVKGH